MNTSRNTVDIEIETTSGAVVIKIPVENSEEDLEVKNFADKYLTRAVIYEHRIDFAKWKQLRSISRHNH